MTSAESKLKMVVADTPDSILSSQFPFVLKFQSQEELLRDLLYRPESSLLFLKGDDQTSKRTVELLRRDRYLDVLPIVYFTATRLGPDERQSALDVGVNDFFSLDDSELNFTKKRIFNLANLYWKLKREGSSAHHDRFEVLSRSVEFLDSLIEHLPNMIFVKEAESLRFVRFNRAGEKLLGYQREDLIGKNDYDFFPKDQADHFTQKDRAVISSGELIDIPEELIHTKEGTRILHTRKIPLYDDKGNPSYLLGISEDISDLKKAEHERLQLVKEQSARLEAEKALEVRDEFLSVASHELKTPLTSLSLQFQIMKRWVTRKDFSDAAVEKLLRVFESSFFQIERLGGLVEDLLDVSRIQAGRLTFNFETHNVAKVLRDSVNRLGDHFKATGCELHWGAVDEDCHCQCDAFRIEQCITNLLTNAMKYGAGKPVEVSLEKDSTCALIKIKDFGIGVDPINQQKIFERFERAVSSRNISGLGLGLFITKQIMQAHHGIVSVESKLGQGSRFTIELPFVQSEQVDLSSLNNN